MTGKSVFAFWPGDIICYKSLNGLRRNGWKLCADLGKDATFSAGESVTILPDEPCIVLSKVLPGEREEHRMVLLFASGRVIKYAQNKNYSDSIWFRFP